MALATKQSTLARKQILPLPDGMCAQCQQESYGKKYYISPYSNAFHGDAATMEFRRAALWIALSTKHHSMRSIRVRLLCLSAVALIWVPHKTFHSIESSANVLQIPSGFRRNSLFPFCWLSRQTLLIVYSLFGIGWQLAHIQRTHATPKRTHSTALVHNHCWMQPKINNLNFIKSNFYSNIFGPTAFDAFNELNTFLLRQFTWHSNLTLP